MARTEPPGAAPAAVEAGHEPNTVSSKAVVRFILGLAAILDRFDPAHLRTGRRGKDDARESGKRRPRS